jgi:hypothetical protein
MAPQGSREGQRKATARGIVPTAVINRHLSFNWESIKGRISKLIIGLIQILHVCGVKNQRAWDIFYDIIFLD